MRFYSKQTVRYQRRDNGTLAVQIGEKTVLLRTGEIIETRLGALGSERIFSFLLTVKTDAHAQPLKVGGYRLEEVPRASTDPNDYRPMQAGLDFVTQILAATDANAWEDLPGHQIGLFEDASGSILGFCRPDGGAGVIFEDFFLGEPPLTPAELNGSVPSELAD